MQNEHPYALDPTKGKLEKILKMGTQVSDEVRELQTMLYELGFGRRLRWKEQGATGVYNRPTKRAVQRLAEKNNIAADGTSVNAELWAAILKLHDVLGDLQQLYADWKRGYLRKKYFRGSPDKIAVASLQKVLYALGYGDILQWERYQNDGIYGQFTTEAVKAFATAQGIAVDGTYLSRKLAKKMLQTLGQYYGKDWPRTRKTVGLGPVGKEEGVSDEAKPEPPATEQANNPLVEYTNSHFTGEKVIAHQDFIAALDQINALAKAHNVLIRVTSSLRTSSHVPGAIVPPARRSNHLVGHAIDFNLRYGPDFTLSCDSKCLGAPNPPAPVKAFIEAVRKAPGLRWGGDFNPKDPVHIDDGFNQNLDLWQAKYEQVQKARALGLA